MKSASPVLASWPWWVAYALITFASFPHPWKEGSLDLGLCVAWFGPACLLIAIRDQAPRIAARTAFVGAWLAHAMILHWIYVVVVVYGGAPGFAGALGVLGMGAGVAGHLALFGWGWAWFRRRGWGNPFVAAALWTLIEYIRSFLVFGGFPWAILGYAQHLNRPLATIASVTGVYGLSFVVVLVSAALADLFLALRQRGPFPIKAGLALALAGVLHLVGWSQLSGEGRDPADHPVETLRMAVLQGNIDQGVKWSPEWAEKTLQVYEKLSRRAATQGAKLIVWPETAVPSSILTDPEARLRLADLARETRAVLVVGGVGIEFGAVNRAGEPDLNDLRYFDSAFVFDNQGVLRDRYDKVHLVPFGEYIPLQALAGRFLKTIAGGISLQGITPGDAPRAIGLTGLWEGEEPETSRLTVGVPICYELVFPDLVRRMVRDGSRVLLGITNDAWYGRTGAPYQFLSMTAMRSAENRVWTVRAANTGVSALIDDRGRVLEQTKLFEEGLLVRDIPLAPPGPARSWYARHGDVFIFGCAVFVLGLWAVLGIGTKKRGEALNE